ncbi:hypothetical protein ACFXP7_06170 [Microbacterium sp. P06]|uniref:hypothetical protein n=1 Tax=Microbacterium sp. P06 TaxID=3366949 RepID=UPI0037459688
MSYDDLDDAIGKLKKAAIDAWMADDAFYKDKLGENKYYKWGFAPNGYEMPNDAGEGGGKVDGMPWDDDISFDGIRSRVDNAVEIWRDLPTGTAAGVYKTSTSSAAASLGASGTGASVADDGAILTSTNTMGDLLTQQLVASFIGPMLDKYYTQFKGISQSLGAAAAILQMNYTMQSSMWQGVRDDVATIIENAESACAEYAESKGTADFQVTLGVVATVAAAVATVATAGAAAPLVGAMVTLSAAASTAVAAISADASITGGSYDELMSSFEEALDTLRSAVSDQESEVRTMLSGAVSAVAADPGGFDLNRYKIHPQDEAFSDEIVMVRQHTDTVSSNMQRVIEGLDAAKTALGSPPDSDPTPHLQISSGTHSSALSLFDYTADALKSTLEEYSRGKDLFDAEVENYFNTDEESRQTVEDLAASEALTPSS